MGFHDSTLQIVKDQLKKIEGDLGAELRINLTQFTEHAELLIEKIEESSMRDLIISMSSFSYVSGLGTGIRKSSEITCLAKSTIVRQEEDLENIRAEQAQTEKYIQLIKKSRLLFKNISFLSCTLLLVSWIAFAISCFF